MKRAPPTVFFGSVAGPADKKSCVPVFRLGFDGHGQVSGTLWASVGPPRALVSPAASRNANSVAIAGAIWEDG